MATTDSTTNTGQSSPILKTDDLTKSYGKLVAVDHANLAITDGHFHSIIGPNGAGKTTMLDLITGRRKPTSGSIQFNGEDITHLQSDELVHRGIARSFQITSVLGGLSVYENIRLAVQAINYPELSTFTSYLRASDSQGEINKRTTKILKQIRLEEQADQVAQNLSYGDRRKLEMGIVLATDPQLVLLDEPTAGMSVDMKHKTIDLIKEVLADATIVLIEHDIELVMELSDRITVLHQGAILAEGAPEEIANDKQVQNAYLGGYGDG